ncbi:hypothetical protein HOLleu_08370 [Holothuria leucospilota]|uniref:Uncharacterized protein n=1 Tax=Holothuria leucospilota TaxID=206669 RepID=A0A9Q1CIT8_HOLLE|nr:hypothetical protein HOLleu_08370 [Holothuria leucospilota]
MWHHFASSPPCMSKIFQRGGGHPLPLNPVPTTAISHISQVRGKHPDKIWTCGEH